MAVIKAKKVNPDIAKKVLAGLKGGRRGKEVVCKFIPRVHKKLTPKKGIALAESAKLIIVVLTKTKFFLRRYEGIEYLIKTEVKI